MAESLFVVSYERAKIEKPNVWNMWASNRAYVVQYGTFAHIRWWVYLWARHYIIIGSIRKILSYLRSSSSPYTATSIIISRSSIHIITVDDHIFCSWSCLMMVPMTMMINYNGATNINMRSYVFCSHLLRVTHRFLRSICHTRHVDCVCVSVGIYPMSGIHKHTRMHINK